MPVPVKGCKLTTTSSSFMFLFFTFFLLLGHIIIINVNDQAVVFILDLVDLPIPVTHRFCVLDHLLPVFCRQYSD